MVTKMSMTTKIPKLRAIYVLALVLPAFLYMKLFPNAFTWWPNDLFGLTFILFTTVIYAPVYLLLLWIHKTRIRRRRKR